MKKLDLPITTELLEACQRLETEGYGSRKLVAILGLKISRDVYRRRIRPLLDLPSIDHARKDLLLYKYRVSQDITDRCEELYLQGMKIIDIVKTVGLDMSYTGFIRYIYVQFSKSTKALRYSRRADTKRRCMGFSGLPKDKLKEILWYSEHCYCDCLMEPQQVIDQIDSDFDLHISIGDFKQLFLSMNKEKRTRAWRTRKARKTSEAQSLNYANGVIKGTPFQSRYEDEVALILDSLDIIYSRQLPLIRYFSTERKVFKHYHPDFCLSKLQLIIEVKADKEIISQNNQDKKAGCVNAGYQFEFLPNSQVCRKNLVTLIASNS